MKDKRSDQELNRIIAKWMGWTFVPESGPFAEFPDPEHWVDQNGKAQSHFFCEDLNAVHEAEMALRENVSLSCRFDDALHDIHSESLATFWHWISAPARQRAEALVKVIEEGLR